MEHETPGGGETLPRRREWDEEAAAAIDGAAQDEEAPLWAQWDEEAQQNMAAALAAAREDAADLETIVVGEAELRERADTARQTVLARVATARAAREGATAEGSATTSGSATVAEAPREPEEPDPAVAGVLPSGATVTAEEIEGMPWYEARVEVLVRNSAPTDEFGEGGDKLAHTRAFTQAPSFEEAIHRLDAELGEKWQHIIRNASLVDRPPTPDPDPVDLETPEDRPFPWVLLALALLPWVLLALMAVL